jgi:hypothetical protein
MANQFSPIAIDDFGTSKPDDFDAVVLDTYAAIHVSQKGKYGLYVDRVLQIDGIDEPYIERDYLDFLANQQGTRINLVPSKDGTSIAGGATEEDILALVSGEGKIKPEEEIEYTGPYVVGTATKLRPSNWSQFVISVKRLFPDPNNPEDVNKTTFAPLNNPNTKVRFDFAKGHKFHFQRLDQDANLRRKNKDKEGGGDTGEFKVLCATAYLGEGNVAATVKSGTLASTTTAGSSTPSSSTSVSTNGDFTSRLESNILTVLGNLAGEGKLPIKRALINGPVVKEFPGAEMGLALKHLNDETWMGAEDRPWKLDKGMLSLG